LLGLNIRAEQENWDLGTELILISVQLRVDCRDAIYIGNTYTDYLKTFLAFKDIDELLAYEFEPCYLVNRGVIKYG